MTAGVLLGALVGARALDIPKRGRADRVTKGVLPFMLAEFAVLALMVLFPPLVTVPAKWFTG